MKLVVALNDRYCHMPDGSIWTDCATWTYSLFERYLSTFSNVVVVARTRAVQTTPPESQRADGAGVSFAPVPYFVGPGGYLSKRRAINRAVSAIVKPGDAVILRIPALHVSSAVAARLPDKEYPFAVEVCNEASVRHPLQSVFRPWIVYRSRQICRQAIAASYVTKRSLQELYPPARGAFCVGGCSNVELPSDAFQSQPRHYGAKKTWELIFVGSLDNSRKGIDVLIRAVARCPGTHNQLKLTVVGGGRHTSSLKKLAQSVGVFDRVTFVGNVPSATKVQEHLDRADLFVLPSYAEGLPRSMIEAMARGLPCIGTSVGGIPELLPSDVLVPPGDADSLAKQITRITGSPSYMSEMSAVNLRMASEFNTRQLTERRNHFYSVIRDRTADWLAKHEATTSRRRLVFQKSSFRSPFKRGVY